jgi:SRSO17 transposase
MTPARQAQSTVTFVDGYCAQYQDLFPDVRSYEQFTYLHVGMLSGIKRKSLPAIAKTVGKTDGQALHHFLANAPWSVEAIRDRRLHLTKKALHERPFTLIIDETGDEKDGHTTDYVAHQYIGNLGHLASDIVSVNTYGLLDTITFPLLFSVYKPQNRLHHTTPRYSRIVVDERDGYAPFTCTLVDTPSLTGCLWHKAISYNHSPSTDHREAAAKRTGLPSISHQRW